AHVCPIGYQDDIIVRPTAKKDPIRKCSDFHPQYCVFDFVNLRASAENVDLNGCIVGVPRSDVGSIDDDYSPAPSVYAFWNGWLYPSAFSGRKSQRSDAILQGTFPTTLTRPLELICVRIPSGALLRKIG